MLIGSATALGLLQLSSWAGRMRGANSRTSARISSLIRSIAAESPSRIQKTNVICVKLNASNVSIPTPKPVIEAASPAKSQSSPSSDSRDARQRRLTLRTKSQSQNAAPT